MGAGFFTSAEAGNLVKVDGKMDIAKHRTVLKGGRIQNISYCFIFQQDNNPKHTARATM